MFLRTKAGYPLLRSLRYYDCVMARYRIEERPEGVAIKVTETPGHQLQLLEAFQECQSGTCGCPTEEYEKVADMEIAVSDDEISLRLKAKEGTRFDASQISACLEYTTSRVQEP